MHEGMLRALRCAFFVGMSSLAMPAHVTLPGQALGLAAHCPVAPWDGAVMLVQ